MPFGNVGGNVPTRSVVNGIKFFLRLENVNGTNNRFREYPNQIDMNKTYKLNTTRGSKTNPGVFKQ